MKHLRLLIFIVLLKCLMLVHPAEPPTLTSMSVTNGLCGLAWTHPTAKKFEILWTSTTPPTWHRTIRPTPGFFAWTFPVDKGVNFECKIRGVSSVGTNVTEWSAPLRYISQTQNLPPDPMDRSTWNLTITNPPAATGTNMVQTNTLVLTWNYKGKISPEFEFLVYQSTDLKKWDRIASMPVGAVNGFTVQTQPVPSFFKVSFLSNSVPPGVEFWNVVTNLVMDP